MELETYTKLEDELETKELFVCPICYLEKSNSITVQSCLHLFCESCIREYITIKISDLKVSEIHCPFGDCRLKIERTLIVALLDELWVSKYDQFLHREELISNPYIKFCPKPDCEGYDLGGSKKQRLKCNECNYEFCFFCVEDWHGKSKCKKNLEIDFENYAEKNNIKFCPKCKRRVEKSGGCPEMRCVCGAS